MIGGQKPQRIKAQPLHLARDKQAQRLMRVLPGETIDHQMPATRTREGLTKQCARAGQRTYPRLQVQPVADIGWQFRMAAGIRQNIQHAPG